MKGMVGTWVRWLGWVRWTVGVVGIVAVGTVPAQQTQQPTFRGGARFVRVDVYPTDAEGKPIEGLTAADFELFEDGKPQVIDTFDFVRIEPEPEAIRADPNSQKEGEALAKDPRARVFAIVLDTRHVDLASGRSLRGPLVEMLDRLIGPRDMFGVITPELPPSSFLLARKTGTVADMMSRYWYWGDDDKITPQDDIEQLLDSCFGSRMSGDRPPTQELVARHRERRSMEHLSLLVEKLQSIREERKTLILITQGWRLYSPDQRAVDDLPKRFKAAAPTVTRQGGRIQLGNPPQSGQGFDNTECFAQASALYMMDSRVRHRELMEKAARANVAVYAIDPRGIAPFDQPISMGVNAPSVENAWLKARAEGLRELALNTDGMALLMNNDLDRQFRILTDSMSAYYLLGYYSTNTKFDGGYRKLQVKVKKPGVQIRARRGYFAPTEAEMADLAAGRNAPEATAGEAALSEALGRLAQLRHDQDLFLQAVRVPGAVVVNVELGVNVRTARAWADGGEVRLTIATAGGEIAETRPVAPLRSGVSARIPIEDPGGVRIEARARAGTNGPGGAADASLSVPAPAEALIGGVMSYRGLARALMPAADGRYRRTERATLEAPLAAGATPVGARVLDKAGQPLNVPIAVRERTDAGGVRWVVAEASLAPLADGDYVIEIEAMKDETRERKLFAIRVVR
ncbi:MAG TPA: VWA domain-containing protein [Vicinamibacterales bacterium]